MLLPPFDHGQPLFRGSLHGHSTHSDGELDPPGAAGTYRALGYDFICLSDHLWKDKRFCADTVLDATSLDSDGFITIPSAELHCFGKKYDNSGLWHILANGLPLDFPMADDSETGPELVERAIDAGAFVSIPHPEWYVLTSEEAMAVSRAHAVEVYNHCSALEAARGNGVATADLLLNEGRRVGLTAADDSHGRIDDAGGGWVMVAAGSLDADAVIESLKARRYYSSTGPEIHSLDWDGDRLAVRCSAAGHVHVTGAGHLSGGQHGDGMTEAVFELGGYDSDFFRVTVTDAAGRKAWSNPYFRDELEAS